ncbi:hypothetical protein [Paludibacterium yongneupense]|nr:hypothetical protein [Paludibacterium yongneupense]
MPGPKTGRPGIRAQAVWFAGYWLGGVIGMGIVTGLLETGMRLLR